MLKERHRCRVSPNTPQSSRVPHRSTIVPLEDVGIVPGNRFILLPLKKVTTIVRRHRCCRSSAPSTKTCIVQKDTLVSQRAVSQTAPSTQRVVSAGNVVLGNNGLKGILRPGSVRSSHTLTRRASPKLRHPHAAIVKTCLSPVFEQEQEDIDSFVKEFLLDQGNWSQGNRQPLEKLKETLHNADDTDLSDFGQFNRKRVEDERILKNQVSEAGTIQATSMSRVHGSILWSEDGVHKQRVDSLDREENGVRFDAHNFGRNTRIYDISTGAPDLYTKSLADSTDRICDDDSVLRPRPSLQETQHASPSLQRHCGIPRAATTVDYLSRVFMESGTHSNKAKRLSQQFSHANSSGSILVPVPVCLGEHLDKLKEREYTDQKGLELGSRQRVLLNRIRQFPGDSQQNSYLPVLNQFVSESQSCNNLVDELQKETAKAQFSAQRDSAIRSDQEGIGGAAAMKQEKVLRGEQQTMVLHLQRRGNKKLRKLVPKIQPCGRRVSPSSWLVGHKTSQVKSIGQQFLLPSQMVEINSLKGVGEFDNRKVKRPGRFRDGNEDFREDRSSAVTACAAVQRQKYLKGFLCSFTSDDDLPIGPLHTFEEQLLK